MDKRVLDTITSGKYKKVDLKPGELQIAERPVLFWTVLGSCVSVILYNKKRKLSAICHAQLAEERFKKHKCYESCPHPCYRDSPETNRFKYVTCSIKYMFDNFINRGIKKHEIEVKLFGGGNVLDTKNTQKTIGEENLEAAKKMLSNYGLKIISENTGGSFGRTLYFYSDTGEVLLKEHRDKS